jgi:benzoate/toluate 1,2-dioxygenase alpha subunit
MTDLLTRSTELEPYLQVGANGIRRLRRDIYTDPEIFELEMKYIWERSWVYVGHESQLPSRGSFLTATIGRQPVFVIRARDGLRVFINACRHRGAMLCRESKGKKRSLVCNYHGWTYSPEGGLIGIKDEALGAYGESFKKEDYGLTPVPTVDSYRGFIFASLDPSAPPLAEHLGEAKVFIDIFVDQSDNGMEILRGISTYAYRGNWKVQLENGVDGYHATTVHWNFAETQRRRASLGKAAEAGLNSAMNIVSPGDSVEGGFYDFGRGHTMIWGDWSNPEARFNAPLTPQLAHKMGPVRAKWATGRLRNLLVYPSVFIMDQMSSQIRLIRPVAVDKTEVITFGIGPAGEDPEQRRLRIRFYEDFMNASGMATPDDLAEFRCCQVGYQGTASRWTDMTRGVAHEVAGPDARARELGIHPEASGTWIDDEGVFIAQYRYWAELMSRGMTGRRDGD